MTKGKPKRKQEKQSWMIRAVVLLMTPGRKQKRKPGSGGGGD